MKFYQKHKKLSMWITAFFFVMAVIVFRELLTSLPSIWNWLKRFISILSPFIAGFAVAFVLYVPCVKIESFLKKTKPGSFLHKHARGISILTVYVLGLAVISVILALILPWIVQSIINLYDNREAYYAKIAEFVESHCDENGTLFGFEPSSITEAVKIEKYLTRINFDQLSHVANGVYQAGSAVIEVILAVFSSIYMLSSRENLIHSVGRFLAIFTSRRNVSRLHKYLSKISGIFYTYIYSALIDALIVAVSCTVAFLIIGVDYAPLFGVAVGLANLVPYFGAIIIGIVVCLFVSVTNGLLSAAIVAMTVLVIQQIDCNILQPKIIGNNVGIQPLYTLMAITVGGGLFGFIGILLGVPIAATIQLIVSDLLDIHESRVAEKTAAAQNAKETDKKDFYNFETESDVHDTENHEE